jgi:MoaE-MoaD fusion protein
VNRSVVTREHRLCDGDEVALLPPVAGGMDQPERLAILDRTLSLDAVVRSVSSPSQGGIVTFTGVVRRHGQLPEVERLEYEAFVPMALSVLGAIAHEIENAFPGTQVAIHHRVGNLLVGEPAVVIAVSAPHRAEAFSGCRAAIEALKQRVPIWKKEIGPDGNAWIGMGP